eukprot:403333112
MRNLMMAISVFVEVLFLLFIQDFETYLYYYFNTGNEYYINSESNASNIELGTQKYPFKNLDDAFREIVNFFNLESATPNITIYFYQNTTTNLFYLKMPIVAINTNLTFLPYTDSAQQQNQTLIYPRILVIEQPYQRIGSSFNPTLYQNGSIIDFDLKTRVNQNLIDASELTRIKYKFHFYNSGVYMKNIRLEDGVLPTYYTISGLISGYLSPFKWIVIDECYIYLYFHILFTQNSGNNIIVKNSYWDTSRNVLSIFQVGSQDCNMIIQDQLQGQCIFDNNTIVGSAQVGQNALLYTLQKLNITFTNNRLVDLKWRNPYKVFMHESFYQVCNFDQQAYIRVENNTFTYSKPGIGYIGFSYKLLYIPRYFVTIIFKGNVFNNNTYDQSGLINFYQEDQRNFKVIFENNQFNFMQNVIYEQKLIIIQAEYLSFKNNTINGGIISSGVYAKAFSGNIEGFQILNIQSFITTSILNSLLIIETSKSRAVYLIDIKNVTINDFNVEDSITNGNDLIFLSAPENYELANLRIKNVTNLNKNKQFKHLEQFWQQIFDLSNFKYKLDCCKFNFYIKLWANRWVSAIQ